MTDSHNRTPPFRKHTELEALLSNINGQLSLPNIGMTQAFSKERYPKIFVVGPLRSGSTLFMQWLSETRLAACPTNLLSRFYGAPVIGAHIQQMLTDPRYNFRNEILDFTSEIDFHSENGKTQGALSPNEFWYFWRRFLPFEDLDYLPDEDLLQHGHLDGLRDELNALANVFEQPFALKAMIMNQNIPTLSARFNNALFIHIHRDPAFNIQSALEARIRQHGDMHTWYSFKIREYPEIKNKEPIDSVACQIAAINQSINQSINQVPNHKRLSIKYEDFCKDPSRAFSQIVERLKIITPNLEINEHYTGAKNFKTTNHWRLKEYSHAEAEKTWKAAQDWIHSKQP